MSQVHAAVRHIGEHFRDCNCGFCHQGRENKTAALCLEAKIPRNLATLVTKVAELRLELWIEFQSDGSIIMEAIGTHRQLLSHTDCMCSRSVGLRGIQFYRVIPIHSEPLNKTWGRQIPKRVPHSREMIGHEAFYGTVNGRFFAEIIGRSEPNSNAFQRFRDILVCLGRFIRRNSLKFLGTLVTRASLSKCKRIKCNKK